jgi:Zn-dependent M28 family amino/carboxypeptidase
MMSTPAGIAAAALSNPDADQIERLLANGHNVSVSLDITAGFDGEYTSHNVIAEMTGSEKPDEIVVIGGHLDSWDLGTGAIDDAAGVGITTGAAVHLIQQGIKPKRTLRVVAFSNEEQGLLGGKAFAAAHGNKDNIIVASESDFGAGRIWGWQTKIDGYSDEWHAQAKSLLMDLGVSYQGNTADSGGPDIGPMFRMGVPVFELNQDGRDYFDLHHTADDTFDKIDPASFQQNVQAWVAMITMFLQSN